MENGWTKRIEELEKMVDNLHSVIESDEKLVEELTEKLKATEEEMLFWRRESRLSDAGLKMAEDKIKELEAENTRLRMLRDAAESRAQGLEEENKYLRAGCQDDTRQCPIVGTNNTLVDKAKELEAEVAKLATERDDDRKREYGYSQQTVDALTLERDKLRVGKNDWKARYQSVAEMHDALIAEFNEMRAENKRLRELVDGATEVVEISNFTFPAQREWKAAWLKKAAKAMKEDSHEKP